MLGSFLPRVLLMVFGYAYPAYECYKTLDHTPEIGRLLFWCRYWVPIYNEAKFALFIYLWYWREERTDHLYNRFRELVVPREAKIDRIRDKARNLANQSCQEAMNCGRKGVCAILNYVSSHQSAPQPHSD
ncbi:hypothetical protein PRUPE_8G158700 [Prunus persica]|uniref:HVA22-like protein n=1 Tax=Prunus persica TaxID=3760 RepID=A0A251N1N9_PRUPE|nr:hypothetical protein PRUPE_8G158700 [Prunus persica]